VGGALLAVEQALDRVRLDADTFAHGRRRVPEYRLGRKHGLAGQGHEFKPSPATISLGQHCCSPYGRPWRDDRRPVTPRAPHNYAGMSAYKSAAMRTVRAGYSNDLP
jgi:hypothetical protein